MASSFVLVLLQVSILISHFVDIPSVWVGLGLGLGLGVGVGGLCLCGFMAQLVKIGLFVWSHSRELWLYRS